jgi:hypothetical protein
MAAKKSAKKTAKKAAPKKAAAKKAAVKVAKKKHAAPTTGQSGSPLDLVKAKLNDKETKVIEVLDGDANPVALTVLAAAAFSGLPTVQANSWTRNSLRRLVRGKWVQKVGKGTYRMTDLGHSRFHEKASASPEKTATVEQTA